MNLFSEFVGRQGILLSAEQASNVTDLSICISHTSSILLLTIGLSGSPQAALSSEPRLTTVSSSSCNPSISSLTAYKGKKNNPTLLILNLIIYVELAFKVDTLGCDFCFFKVARTYNWMLAF